MIYKIQKVIVYSIIVQNIFLLIYGLFAKRNKYGYRIINGAPVSKKQLKIASLLGVPYSHINYSIGPYYGDICFPEDKIVIEYDGYYWHKGKDESERTKYIFSRGWKIIRVKSNNMLPNSKVLKQKIERAKKGKVYQEIILKDWGQDV